MKGQIFIITSILILIALLLSRASTKAIDVKEEELFYESFSNLKNELIKTVDLALLNGDNVSNRLNDFIIFSNDTFKAKGYIESVNYTIPPGQTTVVYLNVSLSSGNYYLLENLIINRTVYS